MALDHRNTGVSAADPDWSREQKHFFEWYPSKSLLASIRQYQRSKDRRTPWHWTLKKIAVARHRFWSIICGAEIDLNTQIAGGLLMPHPNGIVIHPLSIIGPNCLIFQQVTLAGGPIVGGHVDIGAGAKIMGRYSIGDHAVIGANSVVTDDVPASVTVAGVPARILTRKRPARPTAGTQPSP